MSDELIRKDLTCEAWREYEFGPDGCRTTYRIESPLELYYRPGGTTHRVVTAGGVAHCVPAPGFNGCVLRWLDKDPSNPVKF